MNRVNILAFYVFGTDSVSVADEDTDRFWPRFSFLNDIPITSSEEQPHQHGHPSSFCHGLCKNLASLSQMSLNNTGTTNSGLINENEANKFVRHMEQVSSQESPYAKITSLKSSP